MASTSRRFASPDCQPAQPRAARKAFGVYYTPPEIVRLIVDQTLGPLKTGVHPCVLDPACGAGEFLLGLQQWLAAAFGNAAAGQAIFGLDIDASAVATARQRMKASNGEFQAANIRRADALHDVPFPPGSFDVIVGNPPYVNIRQLTKTCPPDKIAHLRRRYQTARGNFDLYVLFIERAIELLRPGGRCGLIVPNKWASLDYARECRQLLLTRTTIEQIIDLSDQRVSVGASVYPHVLIFRNEPPGRGHVVRAGAFHDAPANIQQSSLSADAIDLSPALDVESRVTTAPLGQIARLSCGTAGYAAQKVATRLLDESDRPKPRAGVADFITSGNIARYAIQLGYVRFLNRDYVRPRLPLDIPQVTDTKRRMFAGNKIVIAGMSRRLEAAWDDQGLALGVQVFAASEIQVDPFYLLAVLNSKLLSFLFATRYAAKRLSGGYLAINKGQLARLPIPIAADGGVGRKLHNRLSRLAAAWNPSHEAEIDRVVYELYHLKNDEISRVEAHFFSTRAKAA